MSGVVGRVGSLNDPRGLLPEATLVLRLWEYILSLQRSVLVFVSYIEKISHEVAIQKEVLS